MTRLLLLLAVLPYFAFSGTSASFAQADGADTQQSENENQEAQTSEAPVPTMDPEVLELNGNIAELTMELDDNARRHFYTLYNNNNLISTVKYVRDHIGDAIDACSENNPDMEGDLRARYKEWTDAVNEKLGEAEGQVENMVLAQEYASDADINKILKQANDLRAKTQKNVERIPVTSPEACEYLLNKMDETQTNMLRFLSAVLVAMPQAMDE